MSKKDKEKIINTRHLRNINDRVVIDKDASFTHVWKQESKLRRQKKTAKVLTFLTILIIACIITIYVNIQIQNNKEYVQNLTYVATATPEEDIKVTAPPEAEMSEELKAAVIENFDTVGWLTIEDTKINSPIVQGINNNFYKNRSYDKSASRTGALYMLTECDTKLSKHLVIVGENLDDGTRFADLEKMLGEEFFNEHRFITFDMLDGPHTWEVFSVHFAKETFNYYDVEFESNTEYAAYIMMFKTMSNFDADVDITYRDKVLTLVTPYTEMEEGYLLVHARLVQ